VTEQLAHLCFIRLAVAPILISLLVKMKESHRLKCLPHGTGRELDLLESTHKVARSESTREILYGQTRIPYDTWLEAVFWLVSIGDVAAKSMPFNPSL
jgi:hypothetical protein